MKTKKGRERKFALQQYSIWKRVFVMLIYSLFIGYRYNMLVLIALAPLAIILLSNEGYHYLQQNKWPFEYGPLWIIIAMFWIPVCIQFGLWLMDWLAKYEVTKKFA